MLKVSLFFYGFSVCLGTVSSSLSMEQCVGREDPSSPMVREDGQPTVQEMLHQMRTSQDNHLTEKKQIIENEIAIFEGYRQIIYDTYDRKTASKAKLKENNVFLESYDNIISALTHLLTTVDESTSLEEIKNKISEIDEKFDPMDADLM